MFHPKDYHLLGVSFYEFSFNGVLVASPDGDTLGLARALLLGAAEQALVGVDAAVTPALGVQVLGAGAGEAACIQIPSVPILFPLLFSLGSFWRNENNKISIHIFTLNLRFALLACFCLCVKDITVSTMRRQMRITPKM